MLRNLLRRWRGVLLLRRVALRGNLLLRRALLRGCLVLLCRYLTGRGRLGLASTRLYPVLCRRLLR